MADGQMKPSTHTPIESRPERDLSANESESKEADNAEITATLAEDNTDVESQRSSAGLVIVYLEGWRLHVLTIAFDTSSIH